MKKKIASFLLIFVFMLTFSGCSPSTKAYLEDSKRVNQWDNISVNGDMNLQFTMEGKNLTLPLSIKLEGSDLTKEAPILAYKVTFGEVKGFDTLAPGEEGQKLNSLLRGKSVQYYLDLERMQMAYSKDFLMDIMEATGDVPDEMKNIKEDYIGFDLNSSYPTMERSTLIANKANSDELFKIFEKAFSDFDHKAFNITKDEEDNYHYEVGGSDLYDGLMVGAKHFLVKWPSIKGEVVPLLTNIVGQSITDENITDFKNGLAELEKQGELKKWLAGAKLTEDMRFGSNSYNTKGKIDYTAPDGQFAFTLTYDFTTKRDDTVKVTMPTSVYYLDYTDFLDDVDDVFYDDNVALVEVDGELVAEGYVENGRTFVRYRDFAEGIGAEVSYNAKNKQVKVIKGYTNVTLTLDSKKAVVNGKVKQLDVVPVVKDGVTYVPLRFVAESYGYKVGWDNENYIARLTWMA